MTINLADLDDFPRDTEERDEMYLFRLDDVVTTSAVDLDGNPVALTDDEWDAMLIVGESIDDDDQAAETAYWDDYAAHYRLDDFSDDVDTDGWY